MATTVNSDTLLARSRADESFKDAYFFKNVPDDQKEILVRRLAGFLPRESEIAVPYDFKQIEAYWRGTITNSSKARVTTVQLYLSGAKYVLVKRDDNSKTPQSVVNLISIGDLRPGETVQLSIWSNSGFRFLTSSDVRLTHSSGIGKVIIPRSVTGFPALIDKYDFVFYIILWLIFAGLIVPFTFERLQRWDMRRRKT